MGLSGGENEGASLHQITKLLVSIIAIVSVSLKNLPCITVSPRDEENERLARAAWASPCLLAWGITAATTSLR
jgi:hypothetical protein